MEIYKNSWKVYRYKKQIRKVLLLPQETRKVSSKKLNLLTSQRTRKSTTRRPKLVEKKK